MGEEWKRRGKDLGVEGGKRRRGREEREAKGRMGEGEIYNDCRAQSTPASMNQEEKVRKRES